MTGIAVDAGPLIALFEPSDSAHGAAVRFLERVRQPLVTNCFVIGEVAAILEVTRSRLEFLEWAGQALVIDEATSADLPRIVEIMAKYADLPADLADASLLAMCERLRISAVASMDKDFDIYRIKARKRLRNVFLAP